MGVTREGGNSRLIGQERLFLEDVRHEWRNEGSYGKTILRKVSRKCKIPKAKRSLVLEGQR